MGRGGSGGGGGKGGGGAAATSPITDADLAALRTEFDWDFRLKHRDEDLARVAKELGLTYEEALAVQLYTDIGEAMNRALDAGDLNAYNKAFAKALNSALGKLDNYSGKVYRGSNRDRNLSVGQKLTVNSFWSTSTDKAVTGRFGTKVVYQIKPKTGKNITKLSTSPDQSEVLMRNNTSFRVTAIRNSGGTQIIDLTEI